MVGGYLLRELLGRGLQVRAICRSSASVLLSDTEKAQINWLNCDIMDPAGLLEAMEGVKQVYHCAAIVSFYPKRREALRTINVEGTANVVNAALEAGVKKMVHVSSVAALGRLREGQIVNESMNWSPETSNSVYGESKYLGEMEVWRGIGEGLDAVIVNPSVILGAGDWTRGSTEIFKSAWDEFPWYTNGVTGFVDVRDLVKAMVELMNSSVSGERFILSGHNRPYRELFNMAAKCFGKKPPHREVKPWMASIVWRLEALKARFTGKDPMLTKETARTAQATVHFDNSKLLKFFPDFKYTPFEVSVEEFCAELKARLNR